MPIFWGLAAASRPARAELHFPHASSETEAAVRLGSHVSFVSLPSEIVLAARAIVAGGRCDIAVAFWGRGAVDALSLRNAAVGTRILLNADSGACNPSELQLLLNLPNLEVKNARRLHAKVLLGDVMLVGSANLSANGLGFEGKETSGWQEACALLEDANVIATSRLWFDSIWDTSEPLDENVIERARKARRSLRAHWMATSGRNLGRALSIDELDGAPLYVVITDTDTDDRTKSDFRHSATLLGMDPKKIDFYEDWPRMPKDALLFAYWTNRGVAQAARDDFWDTRGSRRVRSQKGSIGHPVFRATPKVMREFGAPTAHLDWRRSVNAMINLLQDKAKRLELRRNGAEIRRSTDWCLPLSSFVKACIANNLPVPKPWTE